MMNESRPASTPSSNVYAIPISIEKARDSVDFSNMTVGELVKAQCAHLSRGNPMQVTNSRQNQVLSIRSHPINSPFVVQQTAPTDGLPREINRIHAQMRTSLNSNRVAAHVVPYPGSGCQFAARPAQVTKRPVTLERQRIDFLAHELDPSSVIEESVKAILAEYMDEFVEELIECSSKLSRHRGSTILEKSDVQFALKKFYKIPLVACDGGLDEIFSVNSDASNDENTTVKAHTSLCAFKSRLDLVRKKLKKP